MKPNDFQGQATEVNFRHQYGVVAPVVRTMLSTVGERQRGGALLLLHDAGAATLQRLLQEVPSLDDNAGRLSCRISTEFLACETLKVLLGHSKSDHPRSPVLEQCGVLMIVDWAFECELRARGQYLQQLQIQHIVIQQGLLGHLDEGLEVRTVCVSKHGS